MFSMPSKKNTLKTISDLTLKQRKFVDILSTNWGNITQTDACIEAGYSTKDGRKPYETASKLTNPELNPHVVRYLEKRLSQELHKYEKDKLRSYKSMERLRNKAEEKNQFNSAIQGEFRMGQLAGFYVDKKEISHVGLEGMSREQLEKRLSELENKFDENKSIIDITAETEVIK
jgi:phage terminase small subunit